MHKVIFVNKKRTNHHLRLVSNNSISSVVEQPTPHGRKAIDDNEVNFITQALMNRLWIPQTSTIVGLLDVGSSKNNFDELFKWVAVQLHISTDSCASNKLQQLERRFCEAVSFYPEL